MKLITVVNAHGTLEELAKNDEIGAHLAYWMTKFIVKTQPDYEFFQEGVRKLIDKYGEKDGDKFTIPNENSGKFGEEVEKLGDTEIEDPQIRFSLSELSNDIKLSMKQMYSLLDFIEEEK